MRSSIEALRAAPEFHSIIRRWPHAVQTAEGVVIPRFAGIEAGGVLEAVVCDGAIALRPLLEEGSGWDEQRERLLDHIAVELGVTLEDTPRTTPFGEVSLEEEWGDFSVWVR